nr:MAG TPA: hypothetical protein [Caudoviricetes sp.]
MYSRSLSASTYDKKRRLRGRIRRKRSRFFCLGTWIRFMPSEPLAQNAYRGTTKICDAVIHALRC